MTTDPTLDPSVRHIGRSWPGMGNDLEAACPCPKGPCGLVIEGQTSAACGQHHVSAGRTMRQSHTADQCPGAADPTETSEQQADREETERDHAAGDHTHCGITCETESPTEQLRNFVIAKGYPGTKGALAELLRRAAVVPPPTARTAVIAAAIGPTMLLGLQDAELYDEPGQERIRDWIKWISETAAALPAAAPTDIPELRARIAALADDLRYLLDCTGPAHTHERPGFWDTSGKLCEHCRRLAIARGHLEAADLSAAAVLREAADALDNSDRLRDLTDDHMGDVNAAANEVRRMAAETQQDAAPAVDRSVWIDGDPLLEAIAAAVWERCEHSDSGLVIDDPRNIAVAAAVVQQPKEA